jgi:hypothetical protein
MSNLRLEKITDSLPANLTPNTLYFVKENESVTMHITDQLGITAYQLNNNDVEPFLLLGAPFSE